MGGKIEGKRRWVQWRIRQLDGITDSMDMYWSKLWEIMEDRNAWPPAVRGVAKSQTRQRLNNSTKLLCPQGDSKTTKLLVRITSDSSMKQLKV